MDSSKKQEYTLKITNANKTQLIVIIFDMALDYITEANEAFSLKDKKLYIQSVDHAQKCVESLLSGLDLEYELSHSLWHLYFYINKKLSEAIKYYKTEPLQEAEKLLSKLKSSFEEISKQDTSAPLMGNTQSVVAGMTYGKNSLTENLQNNGNSRGYFA